MEVLQTSPLTTWVRRPRNFVPYLRALRVSTRSALARYRGVPVGGVGGAPAVGSDSRLRFSSFFCRFSSAFMRRSASRRSRTLLLNARPPAMESPPDPDCPPPRPARQAIEPSPRSPRRQGTRDDRLSILLALVFRRDEAEFPGEPVDDEVVAGGPDAAANERRREQKKTQHERPSRSHRMRSFQTSSRAMLCSQCWPSNCW